jgi:CHAT domain-containing protein/tetratricopeptide (TPR) repeat protein
MTRLAASAALGFLLIGARPIARGDVTVLKAGAGIEQDIAGAARHEYDLELHAGEYAAVSVDQRGTDLVIRVLDPSGTSLVVVDDEVRKDAREQVTLVADTARAYRLTVTARYPRMASGRYAIRIDEIRPASPRDRDLYEARKLATEAATLRASGKFDDSQDRATRALSLAEPVLGSSHLFIGSLLTTIAQNHRAKGQRAEAEQAFERALASVEGAVGPAHPQVGAIRETMGVMYNTLDDYARAEPLMTQGTAITEAALGEHPRLATCLMDLALFHTNRGDYPRAMSELQRALEISDKTLSPDEFAAIAIVNNLGDLYVTMKDYDRAQPLVERAVRDIERTLGPDNFRVSTPLLNLGVIARERGDYAKSLEHLQRAYAIRAKAYGKENTESASLLISIGNVYHAQKNYPDALAVYQQAYDTLEKTAGPYHNVTLMAMNSLARTLAASGDLPAALERRAAVEHALDRAIGFNLAIGSEREKLTYLEQTLERMGRTLSLHLRLAPDNPAAAHLAAEAILRRKGRVLDSTLDARRVLRARLDPEDQRVFDELSTVTSELSTMAVTGPGRTPAAEYRKRFAELDARRESLESTISRRSAPFRDETRDVTLDAVRAAVPADGALVEIVVYQPFDAAASTDAAAHGESRYAAYVIRPNVETRGVDLGAAKTIDAQVERLRAALRDPARKDVKPLARTLDDLVLRPVRALTGRASHLLIAPDGALNLIPFEVLVDEGGRYAIERHEITYLAGGRDLLRMQRQVRTAGTPLVVADPAFGDPPVSGAGATSMARAAGNYFPPLAGTALEAAAIQKVLRRATVLTGARANKAALTDATSPSILHVASHAFFFGRDKAGGDPLLRAGIALAGANQRPQDAGILTALEASTLRLDGTRLVTLSACDTGLGEVRNIEGVYGLRRAFFLAGSESLIMSLWPVSDLVTRRAMTDLYSGLARGLGRGAALRRVQLAMLADPQRKHPYYWAAFIEAGDWTPLK